ncbi:helix-hairpin-helix domain-containing protein [Streptococcus loxodontisalivarius]|uniref:Helicase n=1 Tax=Streptococcus loxodontisalivarius TaxID=1349415 RepID=A0ABS2PQ23_9STRE|nr:helix-hairpin-helix domain-containing protein [Streptococcus loxodontisalivarius]MBM7642137.1 hypothetical protein [Streptococcus loxodontisalivarius]
MAKKKNRKKELKRQQKLDIKVVPEEENFLSEQLMDGQQPRFVERRLIQNFDELHTAMFQYMDEHDGEVDENLVSFQLRNNLFKWRKDHDYFRQAMITPNAKKRQKLLIAVLEENPNYFAADFHLLLSELVEFDLSTYQKCIDFEESTLAKWKEIGYLDWNYLEARPILQALLFLITYYTDENAYHRALHLVNLIEKQQLKRYPPGYVFQVLSLYHMVGDENKVEQFYQKELKQGKCDDTILIHAVISAFLKGSIPEAQSLFKKLVEINDEAAPFFADQDWLDSLVDIEEEECYLPNSVQSLQASLYPLEEFLDRNLIIGDFLTQEAQKYDTSFVMDDWYVSEQTHLSNLVSFVGARKLATDPRLSFIKHDMSLALYDSGIESYDDFKKYTEKEILSIKGVGPVTIQKLKEAGIVFKK